jgi:hypothetical protein
MNFGGRQKNTQPGAKLLAALFLLFTYWTVMLNED